MAKIKLQEPNGPYKVVVDSDVMEVEIREAFLGISLVTDAGEILRVAMRDTGFEVLYEPAQENDEHHRFCMVEFKGGETKVDAS